MVTMHGMFDEESGFSSIKSQTVVNKSMKEIMDYALNLDNKAKYNHNLHSCKQIAKFDDTYDLQYFCYKRTFLIEDRDFYIADYHKFGEDFSEIFWTSYEVPKYGPEKVIRVDCIYAGWKFKKMKIMYTLGDMKLNQTLVNTTLGEVAKQVVYLKQLLEK